MSKVTIIFLLTSLSAIAMESASPDYRTRGSVSPRSIGSAVSNPDRLGSLEVILATNLGDARERGLTHSYEKTHPKRLENHKLRKVHFYYLAQAAEESLRKHGKTEPTYMDIVDHIFHGSDPEVNEGIRLRALQMSREKSHPSRGYRHAISVEDALFIFRMFLTKLEKTELGKACRKAYQSAQSPALYDPDADPQCLFSDLLDTAVRTHIPRPDHDIVLMNFVSNVFPGRQTGSPKICGALLTDATRLFLRRKDLTSKLTILMEIIHPVTLLTNVETRVKKCFLRHSPPGIFYQKLSFLRVRWLSFALLRIGT